MKQINKPLKKFSTDTIDRINRLKPEELEAHGIIQPARVKGYVCPLCGFRDDSHGTGMEHNKKIETHTSFVNAVDRKKKNFFQRKDFWRTYQINNEQ